MAYTPLRVTEGRVFETVNTRETETGGPPVLGLQGLASFMYRVML